LRRSVSQRRHFEKYDCAKKNRTHFKSDKFFPEVATSLMFLNARFTGTTPRASGLLAKFIGFIGTLKVERLTPSNAFKKTQ
jgi:hypothetical protein